MEYEIREAKHPDIEAIINLCIEHAKYERSYYSPLGKAEKLANMLFCDNPQLFCLVAEKEKTIIGYATYSKECSTWNAEYYVHMDCLFLREDFRGYGIGEAMINKVITYSKSINCKYVEWQTPVFNERAIKFYNRIGAVSKEKLRFTLTI